MCYLIPVLAGGLWPFDQTAGFAAEVFIVRRFLRGEWPPFFAKCPATGVLCHNDVTV